MQEQTFSAAQVRSMFESIGVDFASIAQPTPVQPTREAGLARTESQNRAALRAWGFAGYLNLSPAQVVDMYSTIVAVPVSERKALASDLSEDFMSENPQPEVEKAPSPFIQALVDSGKAGSSKYNAFAAWVERVGKAKARAMSNEERTAAGAAWAKEHGLTAICAFDGCRFVRNDGSFSISRYAKKHGLENPMA